VDLSNAEAGEITFSCLFVLDLDPFRAGGGVDDDSGARRANPGRR
jgi:hypothetical protein